MKTIYLCVLLFGAYVHSPNVLSGQESLLVRTISGNSGTVNSVAFSPDGKYIASGGVDNLLQIWRVDDGSLVETLKGHTSYVNSAAFSPDGSYIASASADKTVKIWRVEDGSCTKTLKGHRDYVWSAVFSQDGKSIASGSDDRTIRIWRVDTQRTVKTLKGHSGYVYSVSISHDGKYIASGSTDHTIKIWDVASGKCIGTLEGHTNTVNSVSFSPAGNYLASGSDDGNVKIWQIPDNLCIKTVSGSQQAVLAVAYSPDGNYLFSGGGDKTVDVWQVSDGMLKKTLKGHKSSVKSVAISPDGKYLASGSFDKTIKIWLTPWEAARRIEETQKMNVLETENNRNYNIHYAAGLQLFSSSSALDRIRSITEFKKALSYKPDQDCERKLNFEIAESKLLAVMVLKYLLAAIAALALFWIIALVRNKARARATLPGAIRRETLSGNYEAALKLYARYNEIGGKPQNLPRDEMLELYRGLRALDDLPKENLPYNFLLSYAVTFSKEGNYRMALNMFRSGRLLNEFKTPEEYASFADIYEKANRPEDLLTPKFKPETYSGLAEAFFKINDFVSCEKMCVLKKQFQADKILPRDKELLSACQKNLEAARAARQDTGIKLRCINCGYIHEGHDAPATCPICAHPKEYFKVLAEN